MVRYTISVTVYGLKSIVDTVTVRVCPRLVVDINRIINTVVVEVCAEQRRAGCILQGIADVIVVGIGVQIIPCAITVAVYRGFIDVCDSIPITVDVNMIWNCVTVCVGRCKRVIDTIEIQIIPTGDVDIDRVIDTIIVGVYT